MKKSLIALAVLGAFATAAQAQTNVQIGGRIQAAVKSYKVGDTARVAKNELRIDDDETSRFWLRGTEDLGGGLKALFYIENRFNTDQRQSTGLAAGAGLADGDTYLGLSGNFGQVTVGKHTFMESQGNAVQYGATGTQALPSSNIASKAILNFVDATGAGNRTGIDTGRTVNSIQYVTPNFSGFRGTIGFSTNPAGVEGTIGAPAGNSYSSGQAYFLAGNYTNGPIYLNAAYWKHTLEGNPAATAATGDRDQIRLSGSYVFPFGLKAGLQYDRAAIDSTIAGGERKRNAWQIPVSYQFGASTILASYTKAGDITGENNSGAKLWSLGYDYALSKRTNVGVFFAKLNNDANASYQFDGAGDSRNGSLLVAGESARIIQLSVKHSF